VIDPDLIRPGMKLTIPDLQKNLNDKDARAELKSFLLDIANVYKTRRPVDSQELIDKANAMNS
jgi:hypothetical protein